MNRVLHLQSITQEAAPNMIAWSTWSDHCDSSLSNQNCTNQTNSFD